MEIVTNLGASNVLSESFEQVWELGVGREPIFLDSSLGSFGASWLLWAVPGPTLFCGQFGPPRSSIWAGQIVCQDCNPDCQFGAGRLSRSSIPPPPPRWSNNGPQIVNLCPPDCRFGPTRLRHQIVNLSHEPPHCQFGPAEPASFPNIIPVAKPMYLNAIFACLRSRHAAKQNTTWAAPGGFRLLDFVVFCACAGCPFGLFSGILPGPKCGCLAFSGVRGLNIGFRVLGFEGLGLCDL